MASYRLDELTPEFTETTFIAPDASLIGRVRIGEYSSVWFNVVLRGDMEHIRIGDETSFQDLSMGHADPGFPSHYWKSSDGRAPLCNARL